jgi:hypothetical protein
MTLDDLDAELRQIRAAKQDDWRRRHERKKQIQALHQANRDAGLPIRRARRHYYYTRGRGRRVS